MYIRAIGCGGVEWIQLAQDRDRWRGLVKGVINFLVLALRSYKNTHIVSRIHTKKINKNFCQFKSLNCNQICKKEYSF
jgi:hypothetical protein